MTETEDPSHLPKWKNNLRSPYRGHQPRHHVRNDDHANRNKINNMREPNTMKLSDVNQNYLYPINRTQIRRIPRLITERSISEDLLKPSPKPSSYQAEEHEIPPSKTSFETYTVVITNIALTILAQCSHSRPFTANKRTTCQKSKEPQKISHHSTS